MRKVKNDSYADFISASLKKIQMIFIKVANNAHKEALKQVKFDSKEPKPKRRVKLAKKVA